MPERVMTKPKISDVELELKVAAPPVAGWVGIKSDGKETKLVSVICEGGERNWFHSASFSNGQWQKSINAKFDSNGHVRIERFDSSDPKEKLTNTEYAKLKADIGGFLKHAEVKREMGKLEEKPGMPDKEEFQRRIWKKD